MTDDRLDRALRDAAEPVPARAARPAARALLDDILRSDPAAAPAGPAPMTTRPHPMTTRRPRLAFAAAALALAATAVLVVGNLDADRAYASWTPDPAPLAAAEASRIAGECAPGAGDARVAIGETRGKYAYVNVRTAGDSLTCFRDSTGRVHQASILAAPADRLGGTGVELYGWSQLRTDEGYARLMAGRLGARVTAVEITVRPRAGGDGGRTVRATVHDGYFAAWYPETAEAASTNTTTLTLRLAGGGTIPGLSARDLMEQPKLN